jgi:hypothetical protein
LLEHTESKIGQITLHWLFMQAEVNGQFDCIRNSPGVSHSSSVTQDFSQNEIGFGAEGFPCFIHSPLAQIQSSSFENVFAPMINIKITSITTEMIFVEFFI